jgi:hypothetical protein
MNDDELRSARLLFGPELAHGRVGYEELRGSQVAHAVRVRRIPSAPLRILAQIRYKLRDATPRVGLDYRGSVLEPALSARTSVLGDDAAGPPRFLIRVDEFPHYRAFDPQDERFGTPCFERFHDTLARANVPYLLAVLPCVSRDPLSPAQSGSRTLERGELAVLSRVAGEGASFALHGRDHRTRFSSPRRRSELAGLDAPRTEALIEAGLRELAAHGIEPDVFVPPYNRFDAAQLALLAHRFAVVCGGPETIGRIGFQPTPQWRGEAVYLPSYAPFYGRAGAMLPAVQELISRRASVWVPIVLHWEWEQEARWRDLERLCAAIAPYACHWEEFLAAVSRSAAGIRSGGIPA